MANSHAQVQKCKAYVEDSHTTPSQKPKISAHADLQNPLQKLNKVLYLDTHISDICAILEDSYRLLTHIFM